LHMAAALRIWRPVSWPFLGAKGEGEGEEQGLGRQWVRGWRGAL
jgi:hypothetical protein